MTALEPDNCSSDPTPSNRRSDSRHVIKFLYHELRGKPRDKASRPSDTSLPQTLLGSELETGADRGSWKDPDQWVLARVGAGPMGVEEVVPRLIRGPGTGVPRPIRGSRTEGC